MERKRIRLATTHLDRHNEMFSVEAIDSMVRQTNEKIIPLGVEHDPRIAPIGRIIEAELVPLDDGEFAIEGIAEIFDGDFTDIADTGDRQIPVRKYQEGKFKVIYDRNFKSENNKEAIKSLSEILSEGECQEEVKKALDPVTILTIGGSFILGAIASGFFKALGADAYNALKEKLKDIFRAEQENTLERLFTFDATIVAGDKSVNVQVILSNPDVDDIQQFFDEGINQLENVLPSHFENDYGYARIVFEYIDQKLIVKYGILKNGIPIYPDE